MAKKWFGVLIFDYKNILTCYRVIPAQVAQFSKKSPGDHHRFWRNLMCAFMFKKIARKISVQNSKWFLRKVRLKAWGVYM